MRYRINGNNWKIIHKLLKCMEQKVGLVAHYKILRSTGSAISRNCSLAFRHRYAGKPFGSEISLFDLDRQSGQRINLALFGKFTFLISARLCGSWSCKLHWEVGRLDSSADYQGVGSPPAEHAKQMGPLSPLKPFLPRVHLQLQNFWT